MVLNLTIWPLKNLSGLEPVLKWDPSTYSSLVDDIATVGQVV